MASSLPSDPRMTPTNDAPVTVEQLRAQLQAKIRDGFCAQDTEDGDVNFCGECHWCLHILSERHLAALASAPAEQEAAFRAGAEAMQRALADALRDHLNPRAAAIANSTPFPEYPA